MTITPPKKMIPTADGVYAMFSGRELTPHLFAQVREELANLRDWDNYFRTVDPGREAAKRALRRILDQEQ